MPPRLRLTATLVAIVVVAAGLADELPGSSPSPAASPIDFFRSEPRPRGLDPTLRRALHEAAEDAAAHGVEIVVVSGWRSAEHQQRLLEEAVSKYGSLEEAARWVATPETSAHVSGDAVDLGPAEAIAWLSEHGAAYGLCQVYGNEPWHYELRPDAVDVGCPPMYPDPTHDPRMQP